MKIKAQFEYRGKRYTYTREEEKLDRNYNDEPYAYFFETTPENELFEINILKTQEVDGVLTESGYVNIFKDTEALDPEERIEATITFENQ